MKETYFLILPFLKDVQGWDWTATGVVIGALGSILTLLFTYYGLKTTWEKN
jgi:uncharacterized membrane protein (DUF373 family)